MQLILCKEKNPYFRVVERHRSLISASRLLPYAPMSLANTSGNSGGSAYPIWEDIDRKRFFAVFHMHKYSWSMALVLLCRCEPVDELHWVKEAHIWKDCK